MLKVIFVDEETNVLNGIKRTLRSFRDEWEMFFTTDSEEALRLIGEEKIDVVVSELLVLADDGKPLLKKVKEINSSIIRIIFTDETKKEKLFNSLNFAHYFLSKPFSPDELKKKIEQGFYVQSILENKELKKTIAKVESLPSLPEIYLQITDELIKPDFSIKKIAGLIEKDLAMSAKILRIVNSGFFTVRRNINSIFEAVILIGVETIKTLVLTFKIFNSLGKKKSLEFLLAHIQRHSLTVAMGAKKYAALKTAGKENEEKAFLAGMFHDIGKVIIFSSEELSGKILEEYVTGTEDLLTVEKSTLGVTHAEVGAYLLSLWGMPYDIVEAVAFHHNPEKIKESKNMLPVALYVANAAAEIAKIDTEYLRELNLEKDFPEIISLLKNQRS